MFSMITTDPNAVLEPVHDRMPAVLVPDQFEPFLSGDLQEFGPSTSSLRFSEAENFLQRKKPEQGEMF